MFLSWIWRSWCSWYCTLLLFHNNVLYCGIHNSWLLARFVVWRPNPLVIVELYALVVVLIDRNVIHRWIHNLHCWYSVILTLCDSCMVVVPSFGRKSWGCGCFRGKNRRTRWTRQILLLVRSWYTQVLLDPCELLCTLLPGMLFMIHGLLSWSCHKNYTLFILSAVNDKNAVIHIIVK